MVLQIVTILSLLVIIVIVVMIICKFFCTDLLWSHFASTFINDIFYADSFMMTLCVDKNIEFTKSHFFYDH